MLSLLIRLILFLGGGATMEVFITTYIALILAGRRTIDQVPVNIRDNVREDLEAMGYVFIV